jgi:hypothetical protein
MVARRAVEREHAARSLRRRRLTEVSRVAFELR